MKSILLKVFLCVTFVIPACCWLLPKKQDSFLENLGDILKHVGHQRFGIRPKISNNCRSCKEGAFKKVFKIHKRNLLYLHEPKPKLMVLFSGTPGMGKSVVAKRLEEKFHAVRLSTDDVRSILSECGLQENLANPTSPNVVSNFFRILLILSDL